MNYIALTNDQLHNFCIYLFYCECLHVTYVCDFIELLNEINMYPSPLLFIGIMFEGERDVPICSILNITHFNALFLSKAKKKSYFVVYFNLQVFKH